MVCNELARSARPYAVRSSDRDESESDGDKYDFFVSTDDVTDILRLTGVSASDVSVTRSVRALKNLLPGIHEEKLCFQVRRR